MQPKKTIKKISKKSLLKNSKTKICKKCGKENPISADECEYCDSDKFMPAWVVAHKNISSGTSVDITTTSPDYGEVKNRITLSKFGLFLTHCLN